MIAHPIETLDQALEMKQIKQGWWMGKTLGGAFFARTRGELVFKYRQFRLNRRRHQEAARAYQDIQGNPPTFLERFGFAGGQKVYFHPVIGGEHTGVEFTIAATGYNINGEPVAWLNALPGCVDIRRLSHSRTNCIPLLRDAL